LYLDDDNFRLVVASTPLISIDLIIENSAGQILLGKRTNRPAQGFWFVPGGRIQKNERLNQAFSRLVREELGLEAKRREARLLDVYEHLYSDSVFGEDPDTHYVVLGYHLKAEPDQNSIPAVQHSDYRWWSKEAMLNSKDVHENTLAYLAAIC